MVSLIDIPLLIDALKSANFLLVGIGYGISLLWLGVRTMVWRALLQGKTTFEDTFLAINEGYLLNNILPFRLGELGRSFLLSNKSGLGFLEVFSTVLIERVLDVAFAAGLLLSTISFVTEAEWAGQATWASVMLVMLGLAGLYLLAIYKQQVSSFVEKLTARWKTISRVLSSQLEAFFTGIEVIKDRRQFFLAVLWMFANWALAFLQYYTFLLAFFPQSKPIWAAFSLGVAALGISVPSSPGNIGVLELAIVWALSIFTLNPSTVTAFAITLHFSNYLITGVLGAYGLAREGETLLSIYQKIRNLRANPRIKTL